MQQKQKLNKQGLPDLNHLGPKPRPRREIPEELFSDFARRVKRHTCGGYFSTACQGCVDELEW